MDYTMWFVAVCSGLGVLGYGSMGTPDNAQERRWHRQPWDVLKLFCFTYTTFPTGDLGESARPSQQWMIIAARDREEAQKFFPDELVGHLVRVDQREVGAGIIFR